MAFNSYSQAINKKYDVSPKHESMRRSSGCDYYCWDHYDSESYSYIRHVLESSVGKNFDKVYSNVCNRFRKKNKYRFRKKFLSLIDPSYRPYLKFRYRYNKYYLDENKIIRSYNITKRKRKRIKVKVLDRPFEYFTANVKVFKKYSGIKGILQGYIGYNLSDKLFNERLPIKYYRLIESYIERALDILYPKEKTWHHRISPSEFLLLIDSSEYITYYEGEKGFHKHLAETKDASNKVERERKQEEEKYKSSLLSSIEAKRKVAKESSN